jgi:hypothetical protein
VVIASIDNSHRSRRAAQRAGRIESSKSTANDHDTRSRSSFSHADDEMILRFEGTDFIGNPRQLPPNGLS